MTVIEPWAFLALALIALSCFAGGIFVGRLMERADRRGRRTRSGDLLN